MYFRKIYLALGLSIILAACGAADSKYVLDFETYGKLVNDKQVELLSEKQVESLIVVKDEKNGFAGLACLIMASIFTEDVLKQATEAKAKGIDMDLDDFKVDNRKPAVFSVIDGNLKFESFQDVPDLTKGGELSYNLEDIEGATFLALDSNEVTCRYPLIKQ